MPPGSAAIELFPYHFDHTLYPGMAALMGVAMYPVHSINGSKVFSKDKVRVPGQCPGGGYACGLSTERSSNGVVPTC
jgi:hypothetical protein